MRAASFPAARAAPETAGTATITGIALGSAVARPAAIVLAPAFARQPAGGGTAALVPIVPTPGPLAPVAVLALAGALITEPTGPAALCGGAVRAAWTAAVGPSSWRA